MHILLIFAAAASAASVLQTTGFSTCAGNATVSVQKMDITYDKDAQTVVFDIAGTSTQRQNVTATLNVTAYGAQVYTNSFNPCDAGTFVAQLCPVPAGTFSARGTQAIPAAFASLVPSIAFQIPDIAAEATLQLHAADDASLEVACIQSQVSNGKTVDLPAVSFVAAGIAGAALVLGGVGAIGAVASGGGALTGSAASAGLGAASPGFTEVAGWFQGMAMNSMLSVAYPPVYRSFAKNFAFSTGLVSWTGLQEGIDQFRGATGGNLTADSVSVLRNATFEVDNLPASTTLRLARSVLLSGTVQTRHVQNLLERAIEGSVTDTAETVVSGIRTYTEALAIPSANTFMTVLLVVAIVIASITVGLLLVKLVLEAWALIGRFPAALAEFRQHYWRSIARAITTLILLLYGVWVLYCVFQFTNGDSWAAKVLAGVSLALFTGVLAFFSFKIWYTAQKLKDEEGDANGLFDDHTIWSKYSLFYEAYRRQYWWVFVPAILYMLAKGLALALGDGHGMAQTIAQLVIEALMLVVLLWNRPYARRSGNVVNIVIQVVRVLSVCCILVFVEEFGIAATTQTVAGVALIAVQSALSVILALLIAWNAIAACVKKNPHDELREKQQRDLLADDNLTPLDARNSLLKTPVSDLAESEKANSHNSPNLPNLSVPRMPPSRQASSAHNTTSPGTVMIGLATSTSIARSNDGSGLLQSAAPMGHTVAVPPRSGPSPSNSSVYSTYPQQQPPRYNGYDNNYDNSGYSGFNGNNANAQYYAQNVSTGPYGPYRPGGF